MKLPDNVKAARDRFIGKFPLPQGTNDDGIRAYTIKLAEYVRFVAGPAWGNKRADPGRPIGKDSIALNGIRTLLAWDLYLGAGTGSPALIGDPDSMDITGQVFVPAAAVDHVGGDATTPGNPGTPPTQVPGVDLAVVLTALGGLGTQVDRLETFIKESDASNERRYLDLVAHSNNVATLVQSVPRKWKGSIKIPYIGTVSIELTPA